MVLPYQKNNRVNAQNLRKSMTKEERHLWYDFLKNYPIKFYRQRRIDKFIVDFYCSEAKLVIELDGAQHYTEAGKEIDVIRTKILEGYGLKIIRFSNREINNQFKEVCQVIDKEANPSACGTSPQ